MKSVGEVIYNAGTLLYSFFAVYQLILPAYDHIQGTVISSGEIPPSIAAFQALTGYDVYNNHTFNKWMLCGIVAYGSMGLVCGILDLCLPISFKTQGSRSYFTPQEWIDAVGLSLFNLFITSWAVMLPVYYFINVYPVHEDTPLDLKTEVVKFAVCAVTVETWFYVTHYALHLPMFYSRIHKKHHRFKAPIAVASMYAHPIEFALGNLLGVILGPLLTQCHPITSYVWICNALISTGGSHSGYKMFYADFHDQHHQYFDYNFGVGKTMYSMHGT